MSIASRRGIPILTTARAFGQERTDEVGARTMEMVSKIEQGAPFHQALTESRLPLSADLKMAVHSGLGDQYLSRVVTDAVLSSNQSAESLGLLHRIFYLIAVVFFGLFAWTFSLNKLIPTYVTIFDDFEIALSPTTELAVRLADSPVGTLSTVLFFIFIACIILLCIPVMVYYIGWFKWEPPFLRRLTAKYHGAVVLRGLAAAVERNESLPEAIARIAVAYPVYYVQQKLIRTAESVAAGGEWVAALRKEHLIQTSAAAVLQSAERVGNLPWALREMAGTLLRNLSYRSSIIMQFVTIAVLLLVSVPIGVFAVALFAPIPRLIQALV